MRIHVVGVKGVVGGATYELFKRLKYNVTGSDKGEKILVYQPNICFICVPEDVVETVVGEIANTIQRRPTIVVRSSVTPGTCQRLSDQWGLHISHNPEFLREATAVADEFNPYRIVIGRCCQEHGELLKALYDPLRVPLVITDPTTSELVKLASNNYFSTVISYWNTIEEIARRVGVSGHQVGMIAAMDPRISPYGARIHQKYGGHCLPKDTLQLIAFAESIGYDPILIKAVEQVNCQLDESAR